MKLGLNTCSWDGIVNDKKSHLSVTCLITQCCNSAKLFVAASASYSQPTLSCLEENRERGPLSENKILISSAKHRPELSLNAPLQNRGSSENFWHLVFCCLPPALSRCEHHGIISRCGSVDCVTQLSQEHQL